MSAAVAKTGHASMRSRTNSSKGHAVLAVGYDDANQWFIVPIRGNWWGMKGYFTLPIHICSTRIFLTLLDDQSREVSGAFLLNGVLQQVFCHALIKDLGKA